MNDNYVSDDELLEQALADQIPEFEESVVPQVEVPVKEVKEPEQKVEENKSYVGTMLGHVPGKSMYENDDHIERAKVEKNLTRVGERIIDRAEIRDGWIEVDKEALGDRAIFYPEDWRFRVKPATVEAIRNWSSINEEDPNSVDDVFNEILKSCLAIITPAGPIPWGNVNVWDRFFFLLLIREYTFVQGEAKLEYNEECPECDNDVTFTLTSQSLMYDMPDESIMKYYNRDERTWYIDPQEFDVDADPINLYVPTLDKEANIKAYLISKLRENPNKKFDNVFYGRFLQWMSKKINKDEEFRKKQIRDLEMKYKSWDTDMFSFMDEVIRNIMVLPSQKIKTTCPTCGEEVSSQIRFPNNISDLFNVSHKHKKFGTK